MNEYIPHNPIIWHGIFAVFGAIVHALDAHRKGNTKSFLDIIALAFMSSFSGAMFALISISMFGDLSYLTLAITGTGGWLGVEGMSIIVQKVKSLIAK